MLFMIAKRQVAVLHMGKIEFYVVELITIKNKSNLAIQAPMLANVPNICGGNNNTYLTAKFNLYSKSWPLLY